MTAEQFVTILKQAVHDATVRNVASNLEHPPGRRPPARLSELSRWYHSLTPTDQQHIREIVQLATHTSVFGLLCVLDGARAINDGTDNGQLELTFTRNGERHPLNREGPECLHDIYQALVYDEVFGKK